MPQPTICLISGLNPNIIASNRFIEQGFFPLTGDGIIKIQSIISEKANNIKNALDIMHLSQKTDNIIDRFRNLFSIFDNLAISMNFSTNDDESIPYNKLLKIHSISEALSFHIDKTPVPMTDLIEANLTDERSQKNWSLKLKDAVTKNKKKDRNYCVLKCIQIIRNNLVHGSVDRINPHIILTAYRLLYPVTQEMLLGIPMKHRD